MASGATLVRTKQFHQNVRQTLFPQWGGLFDFCLWLYVNSYRKPFSGTGRFVCYRRSGAAQVVGRPSLSLSFVIIRLTLLLRSAQRVFYKKSCGSFRSWQLALRALAFSSIGVVLIEMHSTGHALTQAQQKMQDSALICIFPLRLIEPVGHTAMHSSHSVQFSLSTTGVKGRFGIPSL